MADSGLVAPTPEGRLKRLTGAAKSNPNQRFEEMFHSAKTARLPFDKEAWLNVMFFLDQQYVEWGTDIAAVRPITLPQQRPEMPRPVANKIKHYVLDEQADVLAVRPTIDVLPASDDYGDVSTARVALAYLNWLADPAVADFNEQLSIATLWALCSTESYLKWTWDANLKRGDIAACSPLDVYPDPYCKQFSKARYCFHNQFMDVEQVYDIFGVEVPPETVERTDPTRIALQREMGMAPMLMGASVTELWLPPNRRHPEGLYTVWAGRNTLVEPQPYPYAHNQLPFTQLGSIPRPGTPHYTSIVSSLRKPQMELNKFHQQMILVREAFANPKWWIPSDLEMEADPDDSPNQILRGNSQGGTLEPKLIMPTMMPPNDAGAWIENEMMDVAGYHEVAQAQAPGRVDSAKGLELLREQDQREAEMVRTIGKAITIGFWQELQLVQQFGDAKVVFESYSREGLPEAQELMKTKLSPGMRVRCTMGTGLAQSRAAREDQLMTLWGQGIITDPEVIMTALDLPSKSMAPDDDADVRFARNENIRIAGGEALRASSWDNHEIHRREHNNYRKTSDYVTLSDETKAKFEAHVELHDQLEIQQLARQLAVQQMAAAVSQGLGYQNPEPPGPLPGDVAAPAGGGGPESPPTGGPQTGQPTPPGNGGTQVPRAPLTVPNAAGSHTPPDPFAVRDSPQGQAYLRGRQSQGLQKLR